MLYERRCSSTKEGMQPKYLCIECDRSTNVMNLKLLAPNNLDDSCHIFKNQIRELLHNNEI
jgi:hypothetical protein